MQSISGSYSPRIRQASTPTDLWLIMVQINSQELPKVFLQHVNGVGSSEISHTPGSLIASYGRVAAGPNAGVPPIIISGATDTHTPLIEHESDDAFAEIDMDREELKAHLEAQDARVDVRLKSFEQTVKDAMAEIRLNSVEAKGELKAMHVELGHLKNVKGTILAAAGATVIGIGGILAAVLSFGVASFDTGRETSQLVESAKEQTQATQKLLEQIQQQQKMLVAPPVSKEKTPSK